MTKKDIGKIVEIKWFDPCIRNNIRLEDFLVNPFYLTTTVGRVRHIGKECVVLSQESNAEDKGEDLTSIHPALISKVKYYE